MKEEEIKRREGIEKDWEQVLIEKDDRIEQLKEENARLIREIGRLRMTLCERKRNERHEKFMERK